MTLTVSPQVRILAIVGILGALALFIGSRILSTTTSTSVTVPAQRHLPTLHVKATSARTSTTHVTKTSHATVVKHTAKSKTALTVPPKPILHHIPPAAKGLPAPLAAALSRYDVVVVSLYAPGSPVDSVANQEARQGAALAGAGYVALDIFNESNAARLATTAGIGVAQDPAVLIFKRPARILTTIDGYADRETVAQAAQNAAS
jgi:hypothetical protein